MPETLAGLQGWMIEAIVAGRAPEAAIAERILGDERLDAGGRLAVYAGGYRSRLMESLRDEYPALRRLVGDTVFNLFAAGYIDARPPRHFSLYQLGAGFADHLEATRPQDGGGPLAALPAQLARLERARAEVGRAEGVERDPRPLLLADAAMLPGLRLLLPDSVRLLKSDFDLAPLIEAGERGGEPGIPEAVESFVAVARSRYRVRLHALEPWRHAWLEAIGPDGAEVHEAALKAAQVSGREVGAVIADLVLWIPAAAAGGLVVEA